MSKTQDDLLERIERIEVALSNINGAPPLGGNFPREKYLTEAQTAARYNVVPRTLARWDETPELKFPRAVFVRKRRFRELAALQEWERAQAAQANARARTAR
jgi:hypothetical protein